VVRRVHDAEDRHHDIEHAVVDRQVGGVSLEEVRVGCPLPGYGEQSRLDVHPGGERAPLRADQRGVAGSARHIEQAVGWPGACELHHLPRHRHQALGHPRVVAEAPGGGWH
jgi:hypothetical protein